MFQVQKNPGILFKKLKIRRFGLSLSSGAGFIPATFFGGGAKSIVMQIFLLFWDQILGGGANASEGKVSFHYVFIPYSLHDFITARVLHIIFFP